MKNGLTLNMMGALAEPFPADAVQWKPGATNRDKTRGLALAYVDLRHYIDRLNEVAGSEWSDEYVVQEGGKVIICSLTIAGVTRSDVGEAPPNDENTATTALAQAFKRTCVKFGLGAYLYRMPRGALEKNATGRHARWRFCISRPIRPLTFSGSRADRGNSAPHGYTRCRLSPYHQSTLRH